MNLDELVATGAIRPHVADHIRAKTASVVKRAAGPPQVGGGNFNMGDALKYTALAGAVSFGVPLAASMLGRGASAIGSKVMKPIRFRRMMKEHPELQDVDPKAVRRGFNTLNNFAPDLAGDPNVASAFIQQQAVHSLLGADVARTLIGTQKQYSDQRRGSALNVQPIPQFGETFIRAGEPPQSMVNRSYYESMGRQSGSQAGVDMNQLRQQKEMEAEIGQQAIRRHALGISAAKERGSILGRAGKLDAIADISAATGRGNREGQLQVDDDNQDILRAVAQSQAAGRAVGDYSAQHRMLPRIEDIEAAKERGRQRGKPQPSKAFRRMPQRYGGAHAATP